MVIIAWKSLPGIQLGCAGNRDELYNRPSEPLQWWSNGILAGKDSVAMGTWMGINRDSRFAVVTNYRNPNSTQVAKNSRGHLVRRFLENTMNIQEFDQELLQSADDYAGYNLLYATENELHYFSNIEKQVKNLDHGIYGLSNHLLETPWPKVTRAKQAISESKFELTETLKVLREEEIPGGVLPVTGIGAEKEIMLAPIFVQTEEYGTRASSVIRISQTGEVHFFERLFDNTGEQVADHQFQFKK